MPDPTVDGVPSRAAIVIAGHLGDDAVVEAGLMSPDPAVRSAALGARIRLGRLDALTVLGSLGDPDRGVRRRAVELSVELASVPSAPVDRALVALLRGADPMLVEVAGWALGERHAAADDDATRPDPGEAPMRRIVVAELCSVAQHHDDALCREAAVAALGSIGDPAGKPAILASMSDKATVRRRAVLALARFDGDDVDEMIAQARSDRDWQVRQAAEDLSAKPGAPTARNP